jgi:hypothetical protein
MQIAKNPPIDYTYLALTYKTKEEKRRGPGTPFIGFHENTWNLVNLGFNFEPYYQLKERKDYDTTRIGILSGFEQGIDLLGYKEYWFALKPRTPSELVRAYLSAYAEVESKMAEPIFEDMLENAAKLDPLYLPRREGNIIHYNFGRHAA